jgi:hypothetical protein
VGVEGRLEGEHGEDEDDEHGGRVHQLQLLLALVPEQPVDQGA